MNDQIDQMRLFLDKNTTKGNEVAQLVHPMLSKSSVFATFSHETTLTIIRSSFLLNGGALVALPTYWGVVGRGATTAAEATSNAMLHPTTLLVSSAFFLIGLLAIAAAAFFDYVNSNQHQQLYDAEANEMFAQVSFRYSDQTTNLGELRAKRKSDRRVYKAECADRDKEIAASHRNANLALVLSYLSFGCGGFAVICSALF